MMQLCWLLVCEATRESHTNHHLLDQTIVFLFPHYLCFSTYLQPILCWYHFRRIVMFATTQIGVQPPKNSPIGPNSPPSIFARWNRCQNALLYLYCTSHDRQCRWTPDVWVPKRPHNISPSCISWMTKSKHVTMSTCKRREGPIGKTTPHRRGPHSLNDSSAPPSSAL